MQLLYHFPPCSKRLQPFALQFKQLCGVFQRNNLCNIDKSEGIKFFQNKKKWK